MRLAKQHLDIGIFTNRLDEQLEFCQREVGLDLEEVLPLGGGNQQYRHAMNGSVFKLNASRDPVPAGSPSGYTSLIIARDGLTAPEALVDPDSNPVVLVPPGYDGITGIAVMVLAHDVPTSARYYREVLGWEEAGDAPGNEGRRGARFRVGDSLLMLEQHPGPSSAERTGQLRGLGYRYLTVQVWDVDEEHAGALARGATEGQVPRTLGTTARISFLRDPDGNWLEVSQRASLTGALPPG
ncbi:MAG: VOC family protein [Dehalococcoidia bacterium]